MTLGFELQLFPGSPACWPTSSDFWVAKFLQLCEPIPEYNPSINQVCVCVCVHILLVPFPWTLEKEMATHTSILALRIPEMGEPGGLPSMGLHRDGHDWSDLTLVKTGGNGKKSEQGREAGIYCQFLPFGVTQRFSLWTGTIRMQPWPPLGEVTIHSPHTIRPSGDNQALSY